MRGRLGWVALGAGLAVGGLVIAGGRLLQELSDTEWAENDGPELNFV